MCVRYSLYTTYAGYFPGSEGLVAPGMHCSYVVKFTPDSLANYEDQLMVRTYAHVILFVLCLYHSYSGKTLVRVSQTWRVFRVIRIKLPI